MKKKTARGVKIMDFEEKALEPLKKMAAKPLPSSAMPKQLSDYLKAIEALEDMKAKVGTFDGESILAYASKDGISISFSRGPHEIKWEDAPKFYAWLGRLLGET